MTCTKEYRACGSDHGDREPDRGTWRTDRDQAVTDLAILGAAFLPYDRLWVEARLVSTPVEMVRVQDDVVSPVRGLEEFMRALDATA